MKSLIEIINQNAEAIKAQIERDIAKEADRLAENWKKEYVSRMMSAFGQTRVSITQLPHKPALELQIVLDIKGEL